MASDCHTMWLLLSAHMIKKLLLYIIFVTLKLRFEKWISACNRTKSPCKKNKCCQRIPFDRVVRFTSRSEEVDKVDEPTCVKNYTASELEIVLIYLISILVDVRRIYIEFLHSQNCFSEMF